jgi:peptidase E
MARVAGHIVAMGGGGFTVDRDSPLDAFLLGLAARAQPRVVFLPTAGGDSPVAIAAFYDAFTRRACEPEVVRLHGVPDAPVDAVARADVVYVGGGNTANLLAVWRLHGVDDALREAWRRGAVLGGVSAGANCWFEACVTDSFSGALDGLSDGLGLLPGSFCPHYDGEERRRPVYHALVAAGFPAGIACDDFAAAWFEGTALRGIVASREEARGYRVSADGEEPLAARTVPAAAARDDA